MNKDEVGYPVCSAGTKTDQVSDPFLTISGTVVHGVDHARKTDLEMHVRPPRNGWIKGRVVAEAEDSIRITADRLYRFRKTDKGVLCSKDNKEELLVDPRSAEIILCVMEQVSAYTKKPAPIQHKSKK